MTLTDQENNNGTEQTSTNMPEKLQMPTMEIGEHLQKVLVDARDQGRLTCGVYECTQLLQLDPMDVMLCVLPENFEGDVTLHIHFTLLEAFCWENGIRVLKVDSVDKLGIAMITCQSGNETDVKQQRERNGFDYSCVLIEYPQDETSEADEEVLAFYKMTADVYPQPVVELPG